MSYDIEALKKKIAQLQNQKGGDSKDNKSKQQLVWFKPQVNKQYDVRFLTLMDEKGEPLNSPFYEIGYYDNPELTKTRFISPSSFGKPDPIRELVMDMAKDRSKESWLQRKKLTPKERYYSAIIVRGGTSDCSGETKPVPEETVMVWELSPKLTKDIYAILVHPDYVEEDLFSTDNGYDFTVSVNPTDKLFNGFPVKEIKLQPRRKSSPLASKKSVLDKILTQRPNFHEYFVGQVFDEEKIEEILQNFLMGKDEGNDGIEVMSAIATKSGPGDRGSDIDMSKALAEIDSQFEDL